MNLDNNNHQMDVRIAYKAHTIVMKCLDFTDFELIFMKMYSSPYWHPHANLILYFQIDQTKDEIAKIYFILWYYKVCNAIIVHYSKEYFYVSYFNPYINEKYRLEYNFGCWTAKKIGLPLRGFKNSFVCVKECHNVTQHSKLRANNLGTCIGFDIHEIHYNDTKYLNKMNLFEDKGKNLHGFALRGYITEVKPFMVIEEQPNGSYVLLARDGLIWTTISKIMNFTIDLSPSLAVMKKPFNFELTIQQVYSFSHRKGDLFLIPIYQFDPIIIETDNTFPYKGSGLCIMAHRAGFDTSFFDITLLFKNYDLTIEFLFCFLCIWFVFFLFNAVENNNISFDQAGKDLVNAFRNILSISLYKGPKNKLFRIFMTSSIWSFFVLNFFTQAAIISFFSSFKRGKEVNTFEDVLDKGYKIVGMSSPDALLPDTEERFVRLNSKLVPIDDIMECVSLMMNDTQRFCLVDCAIARYLERNKLNRNGEQYLHVAQDRFHSLYLNMLLPKYSSMTKQFDKYIRWIFEAGLIKKWEEYRYADIKDEVQIKPLGLKDLLGIFKCYCLFLGLSTLVFVIEVITEKR
ncbi:uncharacterized protein ACR2FA_000683 [Aphomia sociella]